MTTWRPDGFVELNRTFSDFRGDADPERLAFDSYLGALGGADTNWTEILRSRCTVILAEAGSGKTWEMQARTAAIREAKHPAFMVRLEDLANRPLDDCFDQESQRLYSIWKDGNREAIFFLDAVEEAKLRTRHALDSALRSFTTGIGINRLRRIKVVLSSRITGWRTKADEELVRRYLDLSRPLESEDDAADTTTSDFLEDDEYNSSPELRIVTMDPLSYQQVEMLAKNRLQNRADVFISSLDTDDAWSFVRRPQDVIRIISYWQANETLGGLTELLEFDIAARLKEFDEERNRNVDLADSKLLEGAETLAIAVVLGKTLAISLEHEFSTEDTGTYTLPSAELPDWTYEKRQDLLTRALFDPAAFGAVRFHHRSVAEYLAASRLDDLCRTGLPSSDVVSLFFVRSYGEEVLIPSRAAIACWLACGDEVWNRRILGKLLNTAPEALLSHGDGARLDPSTRQALLRTLIARSQDERWRHWDVENEQLKRLTHLDLAPIITEALLDSTTPESCLILLLRLIREGKLKSCVPAVKKIVRGSHSSNQTLVSAIAAISSAGDEEEKAWLVQVLLAKSELDESISYRILSEFYPNSLSAIEFVHLAEVTHAYERMTFPSFVDVATEVIQNKVPDDQVGLLLEGLGGLLKRMPGVTTKDKGSSYLISRKYLWLAPVLRAALSRALNMSTISDQLTKRIVDALLIIELAEKCDPPYESRKIDLQESSLVHVSVRRLYCWRKAKEELCRSPRTVPDIYSIFEYYSPLKLSVADLGWMLDELSSEHEESDRKIALRWVSDMRWNFGSSGDRRAEVRRRIRDSHTLRQSYRKLFPNAVEIWFGRTRSRIYNFVKWGYKDRIRTITAWHWKIRNKVCFWLHVKEVMSGRHLGSLIHLYNIKRREDSKQSAERVDPVMKRYGKNIAIAYKDGCKAYWKTYTPSLHFEKDEPNQTSYGVIIGQQGLRFAFEDGLDSAKLSASEADQAARYAAEELNTFPEWLTILAERQPDFVRSILLLCIEADWRRESSGSSSSGIIGRLYRGSPRLQSLVAKDCLVLLENRDPGMPEDLLELFGVIMRSMPVSGPQISTLASQRLPQYSHDSPLVGAWLIVWMCLDADPAVDWLETVQSSLNEEKKGDRLLYLENWMGHDGWERELINGTPDYFRAPVLQRLVRLLYRQFRPEDDVDRIGSEVRFRDVRERSERFRDALLSRLLGVEGLEAHEALLDLVDDPALIRHREYLLRGIASRRRMDAEPECWGPGDSAKFIGSFKFPIRSGHDLFALALRRIRALIDELEDADFRRREGLPTTENEDHLQEWLARYFDERAGGQYTVHREVLVAYGKEPDIRLDAQCCTPTSIEVKWVDNWSFQELSSALSDQLVGRYMRARRSRHGILFLAWKGKQKTWRPTGEDPVSFQELTRRLGVESETILNSRWDIDGLSVVDVDFSSA